MTTVDIGGVGELRNAIAQHLKSFKGMTVDPRQIIIGAGTEYLYGLLIQDYSRRLTVNYALMQLTIYY